MSKFVLNKGMSNEFIITIKQNGTTLPMEIMDTDTFVAKLQKLSDDSVVATPTVSVVSKPNGQIKVMFTSEMVNGLDGSKGDKADGYYAIATYKLSIDCSTSNNGKFVAKVKKVYVE